MKIIRLITLLSFFHFSGLNNGVCQVMVAAGKIQQTNFSPVLISNTAALLNPLVWKNVVQFASRRAVQRMLFESNMLQLWMNETLKKTGIEIQAKETVKSRPAIIDQDAEPLSSKFTAIHSSLSTAIFQEIYERRLDCLKLWENYYKWNQKRWKLKDMRSSRYYLLGFGFSFYIAGMNQEGDGVSALENYYLKRISEKFAGVGYHQSGDKGEGATLLSTYKEGNFNENYPLNKLAGIFFTSH